MTFIHICTYFLYQCVQCVKVLLWNSQMEGKCAIQWHGLSTNDNFNHMSIKCVPLIADWFWYCCEQEFIYHLQQFNRFYIIRLLVLYFIDIFSDRVRVTWHSNIVTFKFVNNNPDILPADLQLNIFKADTSDKETSFLDWNANVVVSNIDSSV